MVSKDSKLHRQVDEFVNIKFDFIIVGGGTAGLALATRLSENSNWMVGVLEAGQYKVEDPLIEDPTSWAQLLASPTYTWQVHSVPQKQLHDRSIYLATGKVLGGSSSINIMIYMRGSKVEYDKWEIMGNTGWNWEALLPFFKKAERFFPEGQALLNPNSGNEEETSVTNEYHEYHGSEGYINVSFGASYTDLEKDAVQAFENNGFKFNHNQGSGDATGFLPFGSAVDPVTHTRSSSVNGYLKGVGSRTNLHVLTEALVTRVLFDSDSGSNLRATSVEFISGGTKYTAIANKEIILSAGAFKTPQILELSGFGDGKILTAHGIPVLADLPNVGENLMDHPAVPIRVKLKDPSMGGIGRLIMGAAFCPLPQFIPEDKLVRMKHDLEEVLTARKLTPLQKKQTEIQQSFIDVSVGTGEIVFIGLSPVAAPDFLTLVSSLQHPFSRGSVHIQSNDPLAAPAVDPRYYDVPFDMEVMNEMMKTTDKILRSDPLFKHLLEWTEFENIGSFEEEDFRRYVAAHTFSTYHPVGTAAMAPRELGGVVDTSLKVYGTQNLRVVDASVFPLPIAAHPQATVYAIAEKAADIIKAENPVN